jgi:hypothetical protein
MIFQPSLLAAVLVLVPVVAQYNGIRVTSSFLDDEVRYGNKKNGSIKFRPS